MLISWRGTISYYWHLCVIGCEQVHNNQFKPECSVYMWVFVATGWGAAGWERNHNVKRLLRHRGEISLTALHKTLINNNTDGYNTVFLYTARHINTSCLLLALQQNFAVRYEMSALPPWCQTGVFTRSVYLDLSVLMPLYAVRQGEDRSIICHVVLLFMLDTWHTCKVVSV